jgi:hypothetical protein
MLRVKPTAADKAIANTMRWVRSQQRILSPPDIASRF